MMKLNKLSIISLTALALAACSEQADFNQADVINAAVEKANDVVQFSTYMGAENYTRAAVNKTYYGTDKGTLTSATLQKARFGVFAYHHGTDDWTVWHAGASKSSPNFMYNQEMIWDDAGYWTYSPVKYWPNGEDAANPGYPSNTAKEANAQKVSFFAYAPYVGEDASLTAYASGTGTYPGTTDQAIKSATPDVSDGIVALSKNTEKGDIYVNYVMSKADATQAFDLLWGVRGQKSYAQANGTDNTVTDLGAVYNTDLTKQTVQEKVRFLFKHALAKVGGATAHETPGDGDPAQCGLKVVLDVDANSTNPLAGSDSQTAYLGTSFDPERTLVLLKDVKIRDKYTYTVTEDTGSSITDEASDLATFGWFDIMTGLWSNVGTTANINATPSPISGPIYTTEAKETPGSGEYKLNPAIKNVAIAAENVNQTTGEDYGKWKAGTTVTTIPEGVRPTKLQNVYADENVPALLVIPGSGTGVNNTLYVTVEYVVRTADPKLEGKFTEVTQTITNAVELGNSMEANKYYTLVMHLGLTSVKFEAIVADWSHDNGTTYDENGNPIPGSNENATESVWLPSNVILKKESQSIAADATSATINLSGLNESTAYTVTTTGGTLSDYASFTTGAAETTKTITLSGLESNTTTLNKTYTVTVSGGGESQVITITQPAPAFTFSGSTPVTVAHASNPANLEGATITITKGGVAVNKGSNSATEYSVSGMAITLPTNSGEYVITVTKDDATGSTTVTI